MVYKEVSVYRYRRPANPYGFAVLFYGETDNLRIYGQVKIITVKPDLPSMVFSFSLSSSVTILWAVVGLPVGDIYICACICSCFPLRKCSKTKKRRTREIAYKCFLNLANFAAYKLVDSNFVFR